VKVPYRKGLPRRKVVYARARNPRGVRTPRYPQLRLTNLKREPFYDPR